MSRYHARMLELQIAAENCASKEERHRILGEVAAMQAAMSEQDIHTNGSGFLG